MKINYLEEKKNNNTANFATDTGATANTTSPKPKYRFVMGEKKRKAEEAGQTFTDTWTPPKQTEDYFPEPVSRETFNALNPDGGNSNTLYSLKKAQREGTRIRNKLKNVLAQSNGQAFSANIFDDIDDDTIEKNIPLADQSLKLNKGRNITKNISEKYPNYRDGMAMLYAADEKGNKTAAKAAKLAAYTLKNENLPESATKAEPKVEVKKEPKVEVNNEPEAQNGDSLVMPTGIRLLGNNVNAAVIEKLEANKYNDGNISTFSESVSKTEPKGKSFYEDYKSRSNTYNSYVPWKNKPFTVPTSSGEKLTPSPVVKFELEKFCDEYFVGKSTAEFQLDEQFLKAFHAYMTNGIKKTKRPNNIGAGLWKKQIENDLKWVDEVFGQSSKFAKVFKSIPYISIGVDTAKDISDNVKNKSGIQETVTDVALEVGFGSAGVAASSGIASVVANALSGTAFGTAVPGLGNVVGAIAGAIVGVGMYFLTEVIEVDGKSIKEMADSAIDYMIDGIKSWFS